MRCLDLMLSYAYHRGTDLAAVRQAIGPDAYMMIDSGAFTAHSRGKAVDLDAYAEYLSTWHGAYDVAVTLDVIGDPEGTRRNTHRLWDAGLDVLPVLTVGDDYAALDRYAEQGQRYVCVGGVVGLRRSVLRPYLLAVAHHARGVGVGLHILGVGGPVLLRATGAYSGDSSTPGQSPAFGAITVPTRTGGVSQVKVSDATGLRKHRDWLAALGINVTDLITGAVYTEQKRSVRYSVIEAGLWAYVEAGHRMRSQRAVHVPNCPAGPRLLAALGKDVKPALRVCSALRTRTERHAS